MTLLELVQRFCLRTGISSPDMVVASTDNQIQQILGLLNEVLDNLTDRKTLTFLTQEAIFTTMAAEDQGAIATIAPNGFMHKVLSGVLYNRTTGETIPGPLTPQQWQEHKAGLSTISETSYIFQGGHLYLVPAPTAGQTVAFNYKSNFVVVAADTTLKQYFSADTDTCYYPDSLLIAGLRWIWKREKGLRYGEEFRNFESQVVNLLGCEGGCKPIQLDAPTSPRDSFGKVGG